MTTIVLTVYTADATWTKPAALEALDVIVRGGGGGGSSDTGGGGGAIAMNTQRRLTALELPSSVEVTVGAGGSTDGGASAFGDILTAPGGRGGATGGAGGVSFVRGGDGGSSGIDGETVSSGVVRLLAGGGGGAGSGASGGGSGRVPAGTDHPALWQWCQSGGGGNDGQPGGYPCGGGGATADGAGGLVTVLEYYPDQE